MHLLVLAHWLLHAELLLLGSHHSRLLATSVGELLLLLLVIASAGTMFRARRVDEGTFYVCAAIWRANEVALATASVAAASSTPATATEATSRVLLGLALVLRLDAHTGLLKGRLLLCLHWLSKTLHGYLLI